VTSYASTCGPGDTFVDFERGLNASVNRLRGALGDSAVQPRYLVTVPRQGYRFVAPVTKLGRSGESRSLDPCLPPRLVVLPFEQLQPDPQTAFLCFSLPDAITSSLAGFRSLIVRSSLIAARQANSSERSLNLRAVGESVDVDAIITGTVLRSADQVRVTAQLTQVPAGRVVWTHVAQIALGEIFALQDELTRRIVASLVPSLATPDRDGGTHSVPATARAYEFYLRANHLSTRMQDLPLARDMYLRCLEEDPQYAPAWARLARGFRILAKFRSDSEPLALAEEAFQRAFALSPDLPGIHSLYAYHETDRGRAKEAIVRLLRSLDDHRHDAELYAALVYACRYAGLLEESLAAHRAASQLDRNVRSTVMNTHFAMANYEAALAASTDTVGFMDAMILDALGRRREALERVRQREHLPPLVTQWMRMLELYLEDRRDEAVEQILDIDRQGIDPEGFYYRARLLSRLERVPQALMSLERAFHAGYSCAPAWEADRYLDPVRGTARFQELLASMVERSDLARAAFTQANRGKLPEGSLG